MKNRQSGDSRPQNAIDSDEYFIEACDIEQEPLFPMINYYLKFETFTICPF